MSHETRIIGYPIELGRDATLEQKIVAAEGKGLVWSLSSFFIELNNDKINDQDYYYEHYTIPVPKTKAYYLFDTMISGETVRYKGEEFEVTAIQSAGTDPVTVDLRQPNFPGHDIRLVNPEDVDVNLLYYYELLSPEAQVVIEKYFPGGERGYDLCAQAVEELDVLGYEGDFDLSGELYCIWKK